MTFYVLVTIIFAGVSILVILAIVRSAWADFTRHNPSLTKSARLLWALFVVTSVVVFLLIVAALLGDRLPGISGTLFY